MADLFTYFVIAFVGIGVALVVDELATGGRVIIDKIPMLRDKRTDEQESGIVRITPDPSSPKMVEVDGRFTNVRFFEVRNREGTTWNGQGYFVTPEGQTFEHPISKGELKLDDSDPLVLFGSPIEYWKYRKGGWGDVKDNEIVELRKELQDKDKKIAVLESVIRQKDESDVKKEMRATREKGVIQRNQYRKGAFSGEDSQAGALTSLLPKTGDNGEVGG